MESIKSIELSNLDLKSVIKAYVGHGNNGGVVFQGQFDKDDDVYAVKINRGTKMPLSIFRRLVRDTYEYPLYRDTAIGRDQIEWRVRMTEDANDNRVVMIRARQTYSEAIAYHFGHQLYPKQIPKLHRLLTWDGIPVGVSRQLIVGEAINNDILIELPEIKQFTMDLYKMGIHFDDFHGSSNLVKDEKGNIWLIDLSTAENFSTQVFNKSRILSSKSDSC